MDGPGWQTSTGRKSGASLSKRARLLAAALALVSPASPAGAAPQRDERVYAAAQSNRDGAIALLRQIVNIDSGTGDVTGGARVAAVLAPRLKALGAEVRIAAAEKPGFADNLVAVFQGTGKGRILIIAHIDTVFPPGTAAKRPFSIAGAQAHGPGALDCKSGVTAAVTALKILHDLGYRNFATITLLLDGSEEQGSPGSSRLIASLAAQHDVEFNLEGGFMPDDLIVWRKGSANIRIAVRGRTAHAGVAPQDGRNAATELLHQLGAIDGAFPHAGDGTTVNLTVLKSGDRPNVIPDLAEATLNVRFRKPEDFTQVMARVRRLAARTTVPDTAVAVSTDPAFPPMAESPAEDALLARTAAIYGEIGRKLGHDGSGGASESALAAAAGIPALDGLGFVGANQHSERETMDLTSVTPRLYLLTRLLMDVGAEPPARK